MLSKAILGNYGSVGLASPATNPKRKKPTSRETLKKPPGLIFKSTPSEGKERRGGGNERENERGRGLCPKMGKHKKKNVEPSGEGKMERYRELKCNK